MAKTVFVTQIPSRRENGVWIPTVDITPAKEFGHLEILSPAGLNQVDLRGSVATFEDRLKEFQPGDHLLPLGDPLLMVMAAAFLGKKFGEFDVLKWDRKMQRYFSYAITVNA